MEPAVKENRQSESLPSLSYIDTIKSAGPEYRHRRPSLTGSTGPLVSPHSIYSGPPPPYSYQSTTVSTMPALNGLASPPDSRRTSGDEKEANQALLKQSLPSISEALGGAQPKSFPAPPAPITTVHLPPSSPRSGPSPPGPIPRSHPPDSAHVDPHAPMISQPPAHHSYASQPSAPSSTPSYHAPYPPPAETRRPSVATSFGADRLPSLHSLGSGGSPEQRPRMDRYAPSYEHSSPRSTHTHTNPMTAHTSPAYGHNQPPYQYSSASSNGTHPLNQPPHTPYASQPSSSYTPRYEGHPDAGRSLDGPSDSYRSQRNPNGERYGTSVKRHLDYFDLENALNEIVDSSARVHDFSRDFKDRARELPRTGPGPGMLPSIAECDAMISHQGRVQDLLVRLRDMLVTQQNAMSSQPGPEPRYKGHGDYDLDGGVMYEDGKGDSFMGPEAKKRRGRAAPPGRCHSCNRAETPEWRRGPDGARTLCNACGLHYAKLTRKMGSKGAIPGSSSLRPKSLGPGSPQ